MVDSSYFIKVVILKKGMAVFFFQMNYFPYFCEKIKI